MAPPNAWRGMPSQVRSRFRSDVSHAPARSAHLSAGRGSRASNAFPRPSSGSVPPDRAAERRVSS
jgi:hypothetical protein